jgi:hypothetical protein
MNNIPTDGLIAYFPLRNNLIDQTNDASAADNGITFSKDSIGEVAVCDGSGRAVGSLGSALGSTFTLIGMIKTLNRDSGQNIFATGSNSPYQAAGLQLNSGIFALEHSHGNISSEYFVADGQWHVCAATVAETTVKLYIDGSLIKTATASSFNITAPAYTIADFMTNEGYYYQGYAAHIMAYNRPLDDAEIAVIHRMLIVVPQSEKSSIALLPPGALPEKDDPGLIFGNIFVPLVKPLLMPTVGLLAHYPLTADGNDASGNGRHAVVSGSPTFGANGASGFSAANYLSLPASLLAGVSAFTISMKLKVISASKCAIYYAKGSTSNSERNIAFINAGSSDSGWFASWQYGVDSAKLTFTPAIEYHVLFIWNGSSIVCKINLEQKFSTTYSDFAGVGISEHSLGISQYQVSANGFGAFNGSIRAVRFYNRALDIDEQALLQQEK